MLRMKASISALATSFEAGTAATPEKWSRLDSGIDIGCYDMKLL